MNNVDILENRLDRKWWILIAVGAGTFMSALDGSVVNTGSAPRHRQGIASGILATARNVGMVLGVGLAGAFLRL